MGTRFLLFLGGALLLTEGGDFFRAELLRLLDLRLLVDRGTSSAETTRSLLDFSASLSEICDTGIPLRLLDITPVVLKNKESDAA